ncbi:MAG: DUF4139 domain-containing protein [Myxococcales bacterium]|nr:DUF4139 domain-containing protein [Myxococcales bacterium]
MIATRIDRVVVHPGGAVVTRVAEVEVAAPGEVVLAGLPWGLDDDSVQIAVAGPALAATVRIAVDVVAAEDGTAADDELRAAAATLAALVGERTAIKASLAALAGLAPVAPAGGRETRPDWGEVVAARRAVAQVAAARAAALRAEHAELERQVDAAQQAVTAAEERRARRSSAERVAGALTKAVVASVVPVGAGGVCAIACTYRVPGARWAPTYVARLIDGEVRLELRAVVAQATGEDWADVALELSTATAGRQVELPELPAIRIGRAQPTPARAGWRAPPVGVEDLYRDWDRGFSDRAPPAPPAPPPPPVDGFADDEGGFLEESTDEVAMDLDRVNVAPSAPPKVSAPPSAGAAAPAAMMAPLAKKSALGGMIGRGGGGAQDQRKRRAMAPAAKPVAAAAEASEISARDDLLEFGALYMPGPGAADRGRLRRVADERRWKVSAAAAVAAGDRVLERVRGLIDRAVPPGCREPSSGQYDYAFATSGRVDVGGDGAWHAIAVAAHAAPAAVVHVVTPAVAPEVYRVATVTNPLPAPLLTGPVDVYEGDELVLTAALAETPPGGVITIGLGVDAEVKVARNVRYREEAAGVLRGSLRLLHDVTIDVDHLGRAPIELEVRERVPIPAPDVDDVEVAIDEVVPIWEPWRPEPAPGHAPLRGGHRWRVRLASGERRALRLAYAIKIAGKHELVGGNRRDA